MWGLQQNIFECFFLYIYIINIIHSTAIFKWSFNETILLDYKPTSYFWQRTILNLNPSFFLCRNREWIKHTYDNMQPIKLPYVGHPQLVTTPELNSQEQCPSRVANNTDGMRNIS